MVRIFKRLGRIDIMKPDEIHLQDLEIVSFVLGLAATNAYLVADPASKLAVVIDPAWDGDLIYREAELRGWRINQIWLTHAHFDHFGGAGRFPIYPKLRYRSPCTRTIIPSGEWVGEQLHLVFLNLNPDPSQLCISSMG